MTATQPRWAITKGVDGHPVGDEKKEATKAITDVLFDTARATDSRTRDQGA
ncbi:MAG TPA: hypothetical protein VMO52_00450 [Acidimicrobiia bacterium]|nr:hypothetical protein [Acidimicrobiia bacterium]